MMPTARMSRQSHAASAWLEPKRPLRVAVIGHPPTAALLDDQTIHILRIDDREDWARTQPSLGQDPLDAAVVHHQPWPDQSGLALARSLNERGIQTVLIVSRAQAFLLEHQPGIIEDESHPLERAHLERALNRAVSHPRVDQSLIPTDDIRTSPNAQESVSVSDPEAPTQPHHALPMPESVDPKWHELLEADKTDGVWHLAMGLIVLAVIFAMTAFFSM